MAKIKINNLPEGFEIIDGKVVEKKAHGGATDSLRTGDQSDYGLVAFTGSPSMSDSDSTDVRFSLSKVPKSMANLEAEGGETVLTDLNQDGNFGLYDINGPRHSNGGVPMYLPDQSFIFSDTKTSKISKDDLNEFGISSKKKMTPAKVSKKFDLNQYYGAINDEYADEIQVRSAELMLNKNMNDLSHLAFKQELDKDWRDGVPMAAYPYLVSKDIDPIEFTSRVEEISQKKAMQQAVDQLPAEQQMQMAMMQELQKAAQQQQAEEAQQAEEVQQGIAQSGIIPPQQSELPPDAMPPEPNPDELDQTVSPIDQAKYGLETYQNGKETDNEKLGQTGALGKRMLHQMSDEERFAQWVENATMEEKQNAWESMISDQATKLGYEFDDDISGLDAFSDFGNPGFLGIANTFGGFMGSTYELNGVKVQRGQFLDAIDRYSQEELSKKLANGDLKTNNRDVATEIQRKADPNFVAPTILPEKEDRITGGLWSPDGTTSKTDTGTDTGAGTGAGKGRVNIYDSIIKRQLEHAKEQDWDYMTGLSIDPNLAGERDKFQTRRADGSYGDTDLNTKEREAYFFDKFPWARDIEVDGKKFDYYKAKGEHWRQFQEMYEQKRRDWSKANGMEYVPYFKERNKEEFKKLHPWAADEELKFWRPYVSGEGFDGKHGEHTDSAPRLDPITDDEEIQKAVITKDPEVARKIEAANLESTYTAPRADWWLQDLIQLNAINNRKRKAFMPWQPDVEGIDLDFVLEDPTRAIAAINEQLGIQTQAAGMFGGPQSLAARTAQAQGKAATAIANEIGRVNQRNVSTINRGNAIQARYDALINRERRDRKVKQYDDTQKVLQLYMDERNFDNDQYSAALANAVTNRANTYNLNSIQDYYKISPLSGGKIGQFSQKAFEAAPIPGEYDFVKPFAEIAEQYYYATGQQPTNEMMRGFMDLYTEQQARRLSPQETNLQREMRSNPYNMPYGTTVPTGRMYPSNMATTGSYYGGQSFKEGGGKAKRKLAVPFYVGMTMK